LSEEKVKISLIVRGDFAELLIRLKERGRIRSFTDGVLRGLDLLAEKTAAQDLRRNRAESVRGSTDE